MKTLICLALAFAACAVASTIQAATPVPLSAASALAHQVGAKRNALISKAIAEHAANAPTKRGDLPVVRSALPGVRLANPYRAYPPSCAADPLPDTPSGGLIVSQQMQLYTRDSAGTPYTPETVTITIWRLPCSSSGNLTPYNVDGLANAITLMRITRTGTSTDIFPTFPDIRADQGSSTGNFVRSAVEPNTVISEAPFDSPILASTTYVLENYPADSLGYTYYNYDFDLIIDPVINGVSALDIPVGGYSPTQSGYPGAFQDLPIDGYMSASWYDPAHVGEGMLTQIIDNSDLTRTFFAAWYSYDDLGIPFWITASGSFADGANVVDATGYYQTGGGFAGDFGSSSSQHIWGTLTFSFPDCGSMSFTFNGQADQVQGGPAGNGSRTWTRIADTNGLNCE